MTQADRIASVPVPARMAKLPKDSRGYPIPFNVARGKDGFPLFTINDDRQHITCLYFDLCPICGDGLGRVRWFVGGPLSAFSPNGAYQDLPAHQDCAEYSLGVCPYLAMPVYMGRVDVNHPDKLTPDTGRILINPTSIPGRPEVFVAVGSTGTLKSAHAPVGSGLRTVKPTLPWVGVTYWRHGQQITADVAAPFIQSSYPELANWAPRKVRP